MSESDVLFYILSLSIITGALFVLFSRNPLHSALSLVVTMISLAFVFFLLEAPFIAGVQLVVYAGAVMVLFVMVLMLFDLKKEKEIWTRGPFSRFIKISLVGWFCGLVVGSTYMSIGITFRYQESLGSDTPAIVRSLAHQLFTQYVFAFEALGLLLLLIAIGVVAVSRIKGGTHVK